MKKIQLIFCVLGLFLGHQVFGQQDPQYTQYMYNMNVVNPAYAGSTEGLSIGALYRDQWSGFKGAPRTFTFNVHSPLGNGLGAGLSAISDKAGPVTETNAYADISYTLDFDTAGKLAFGVKAGATFHDIGLTDLDLQDPGDIAFSENVNKTTPNFGAGLLYYTDNWYVGFSVPNLLKSKHLDANGQEFGSEEMHWFATAGYVFDIGENFKLKPSTLFKSAFGAPVSFDVNLNALFYEVFEIGASYRYEDSFSGLIGVRPTSWMQIGFAYDHSVSDIDKPSYEGFVLFNIPYGHKSYRSPRYF